MLRAVGAPRIELLTNNPDKRAQLERLGIEVTARRSTGVFTTPANASYLRAKVEHTGHALALPVARLVTDLPHQQQPVVATCP
jgi:GTP cyclohydrolase II